MNNEKYILTTSFYKDEYLQMKNIVEHSDNKHWNKNILKWFRCYMEYGYIQE